MLIRPNGAPATRQREQLKRIDVKTIIEFEQWAQSKGLAIDIYCKKCVEEHGPGGRCWGNNARDGQSFHLECQCTDRVYGKADLFTSGQPVAQCAPDPKIQVVVP